MTIKVKRLRPEAKLPTRAYDQALAYDFYFAPEDGEDLLLEPVTAWRLIRSASVHKLATGVAVELPTEHGMILRERGSTGVKGLSIRAGVIDGDYRGEVFVLMQNLSHVPILLKPGDKIVQGILIQTPNHAVVEVDELSDTKRGTKCLGSSGK